ncbi:PepSY-associated TM helix domain-containing protein [Litorilituus sediminis]|uniref:PepSY domain-containing protein n=1 Tax=Litorilituus sediminis TaxID=718192 RepID=A0A4P6P7V6_9GAMM|nr:PepSY-associated TM helix domain-containing protein [Litorilituus sediminis]QBG35602.1 PepSY domain-containing protein [Litorilituus sediminis]
MKIRKILFWLHLILGCSAALFVFIMSITGVALTYERQMIKLAERSDYIKPENEASKPLSLDKLTAIAQRLPAKKAPAMTLINERGAPVIVKEGRKTLAYLNPYTGEKMVEPGKGTKVFFKKLRAFHRWLTLDGKFSEAGRWVNGIANLIFFILLLTGLYLWLPNRFKAKAFKQKLTLTSKHNSVKARDYNWHNVFGFYMAPILFVVIATAFFFSFKWPGQTLKDYLSTDASKISQGQVLSEQALNNQLSHQQVFELVTAEYSNWQTIRLSLADLNKDIQVFQVDNGNGGEPQKRLSVAINSLLGEIVDQQSFQQLSTYRQARSYIRFLHTGEALGLVGQTLAGIASLLACLLVYTGVMLSWRRWQASKAAKQAKLVAAQS